MTVKHFGYGGGRNHVRELANALAVRGHRVWVAAPPGRQAALLRRSVEHVPVSYSDLNHPFQALRLAEANRAAGRAVVRLSVYLALAPVPRDTDDRAVESAARERPMG